jgi:hypothetical protein
MKTGVQRESWIAESERVSAELERLCLNCGEPLHGAFCSNCGQRVVPPRPSLRELLGEAFAEFSGWDGKLAATLRLLVTRPGQLTVDFLDGKRARYITPLRLYLSVSLVYFLLSAAAPPSIAPGEVAKVGNVGNAKITVGLGSHTPDQLTAEQRQLLLAEVSSTPKPFRPALRRLATDPQGFQRDFTEVMPKLMFALLPVFALIVALFYRGRGFVEHLYFTIHVQTFFFVALGFGVLSRFTHVIALIIAMGILQFIWAPLYAHFSLRRVYGGSNGSTVLKELGIGALYAAVYLPSVVSLAVWIGSH